MDTVRRCAQPAQEREAWRVVEEMVERMEQVRAREHSEDVREALERFDQALSRYRAARRRLELLSGESGPGVVRAVRSPGQ